MEVWMGGGITPHRSPTGPRGRLPLGYNGLHL